MKTNISENIIKQELYWKNIFKDKSDIPVLNLPTDFPSQANQSLEVSEFYFEFDEELTEKIKKFTENSGSTLFHFLVTAYFILLYKYSAQLDIVIGVPDPNRKHLDIMNVVMLEKVLPIRSIIDENKSFLEYQNEVKTLLLDAFDNQDYHLEKLIDKLELARDVSRNSLFDASFIFENLNIVDNNKDQLMSYRNKFSKFIITLNGYECGAKIKFKFEYCSKFFKQETIKRMSGHFKRIFSGVLNNPNEKLYDVDILCDEEKSTVLRFFNKEYKTDMLETSLIEMFEKQVLNSKDHIALSFLKSSISYNDLNKKANQLAHTLQRKGINKNDCVAIMVPRSMVMIIGILAVLKCGASYLPIDSEYPDHRINYMIADSNSKLILSHSSLIARTRNYSIPILDVSKECNYDSDETNLDINYELNDIVYTIYTSGSTGYPKGVIIENINLVNFIHGIVEAINFQRINRVLGLTTIAFDTFALELFVSLCFGKEVILASEEEQRNPDLLKKLIYNNNVELVQMTPSRLKLLYNYDNEFRFLENVKILVAGGEHFDRNLLVDLQNNYDGSIYNVYGPTETTVWSTVKEITHDKIVTIGKPILNTKVLILSKSGLLQPIGIPGELCISGLGVARGYTNDKIMTNEKFLINPYGDEQYKLYKTGDQARWLDDGNIEFCGRLDNQIKLRGYRIELNEIESVLNKHEYVRNAAVTIKNDNNGNKNLVAYVVLNEDIHDKNNLEILEKVQKSKMSQWSSIWDSFYSNNKGTSDPKFNTSGWNDSYEGKRIPENEMREWFDSTIERILFFKPQDVLEIGCGTGMFLFDLSPKCKSYFAIDISNEAIRYIDSIISNSQSIYNNVKLHCSNPEDYLKGCENEYDFVLMNSVVQYFPDINYLVDIIKGISNSIKDGGIIYIGDIRNYELIKAFHTSIVLHKASDLTDIWALKNEIECLCKKEEELLISPIFFYWLKKFVPEISNVEICYKKGDSFNELTRFRYDAILHIKQESTNKPSVKSIQWDLSLDSKNIFAKLDKKAFDALIIRNIPNRRIRKLLKQSELIFNNSDYKSIIDLYDIYNENEEDFGFLPNEFLGLHNNYFTEVVWSGINNNEYFDVVYCQKSLFNNNERLALPICESEFAVSPSDDWSSVSNNPLKQSTSKDLIYEVKNYLKEQLPKYMIPTYIMQIEEIPLTVNKKIDYKRLPDPRFIQVKDRLQKLKRNI